MISKELSATLGFAVREAKKRRHEYVSIEHILFAILYDPTGMDIIENCGGNVENLIVSLEDFFEENGIIIDTSWHVSVRGIISGRYELYDLDMQMLYNKTFVGENKNFAKYQAILKASEILEEKLS